MGLAISVAKMADLRRIASGSVLLTVRPELQMGNVVGIEKISVASMRAVLHIVSLEHLMVSVVATEMTFVAQRTRSRLRFNLFNLFYLYIEVL